MWQRNREEEEVGSSEFYNITWKDLLGIKNN